MNRDNRLTQTACNSITFLLCVLVLFTTAGCTDIEIESEVDTAITLIEQQRLLRHVTSLTAFGPRSSKHPAALDRTLQYIEMQLLSYDVRFEEELLTLARDDTIPGAGMVNLIAVFPGIETADEIFEIGAHYDTVEGTPGADDNASGIAALLEIARVLSVLPNRRTIRLCFFAQEEDGLGGSTRHVLNMKQRNEKLAGTLILEMIAYTNQAPGSQASPIRIPLLFSPPDTGNFIAVVGNFRSGSIGNLFEAAVTRHVPELRLFSINRLGAFFQDAVRSDNKPYWDHDYKAVMLTDTANFRNPHYHRPSDTADTLDYEFLRNVARASLATAIRWSGLSFTPNRKDK